MKTLVPQGNQLVGLELAKGEKVGEIPIAHVELDSIRIQLGDGRTIELKQAAGTILLRAADLDGNMLAEITVPEQSPEMVAKSSRLHEVSRRFAERMTAAMEEVNEALKEEKINEATELPVIPLPGPARREN